MTPFVSRPLGMPKLYPPWIGDALPAGLVRTVWLFEKSVQMSMNGKHNLKRTLNIVFGRMSAMLQKTWVLLLPCSHSVVGLAWFSSYEIITPTPLINPSACHFAGTSKEYAATFSTIKSSGSVQNWEKMVNTSVIVLLNESIIHTFRFQYNHSNDNPIHTTWFTFT